LSSSNPGVKVKKAISVTLGPGKTVVKPVFVKVGKKARGQAVITAKAGVVTARSSITIRPVNKGPAKNRRTGNSR